MRKLFIALASILIATCAFAQPKQTEYGPPKGTLIIIGGGPLDGTGIIETFIERAGGAENGRFVIVPTNNGNHLRDGSPRPYQDVAVLGPWKARGLKTVVMLHTHDPKVADTEAFIAPLKTATGVWFDGGRQWNMVDSYKGTLTEREIHAILDRGGVVAGTSAGATIQGDYLVRGDTSGPSVMMTAEPNHQKGFALLRKSAIDQHIDTRDRWRDLEPVMAALPGYLGIGLSEGAAIVVQGDRFDVIGRSKVAIHDGPRPYFTLQPGDAYDMKARQVLKGPANPSP